MAKCRHNKEIIMFGPCQECADEREVARAARVRRRIDRLARLPFKPSPDLVAAADLIKLAGDNRDDAADRVDELLAPRQASAAATADTQRARMIRLSDADRAELARLLDVNLATPPKRVEAVAHADYLRIVEVARHTRRQAIANDRGGPLRFRRYVLFAALAIAVAVALAQVLRS